MKKLLLIALLMLTIVFAAVACKDNTAKPVETTVEDGTTAEPTTTVALETTIEPETTIAETTITETTVPETTVEETTAEEIDLPSDLISYDDYCRELCGISADAENVEITGDCIEIITVDGEKYFHAKNVGTAYITRENDSCAITVEKAKLNIIVVMGQSNSGNHFDNALSDITNPIGTAYWWGSGLGTAATEPTDFTHATKGFHSTLLAELYAQSNGKVKNVLVWHEGGPNGEGTSKNGTSIYGWARNANDSSGTNYTVKMVNDCVNYYTNLSDKYEIVSKGAYWLQGEGDVAIPTSEYMDCFMAMWKKLKSKAGLQYMAIMRVRHDGGGDANNDIYHTSVVSAQFTLANQNKDIFMATTITENFVGTADTLISIDISKYKTMMETYGGAATHNDSFGNTATYANGVLTTPMKTIFGSNNLNHYGKFGYTIIAADAAYNMYSALEQLYYASTSPEYVAIVQANLSGKRDADNRRVNKNGDVVTLNITNMNQDLRFYADPGSAPGKLTVKVYSGAEDVTDSIIQAQTTAVHNSISTRRLKNLGTAKIVVTYTLADGTEHVVTYNTVYNK